MFPKQKPIFVVFQCEQVARIYTGMPVYTGILAKSGMNFARIFARISLVFLLKMRPYFARIFTKMSPYEELVTLKLTV